MVSRSVAKVCRRPVRSGTGPSPVNQVLERPGPVVLGPEQQSHQMPDLSIHRASLSFASA